jgi:hypothetical protein
VAGSTSLTKGNGIANGDGKLSELVAQAIQSGQVVLVATTFSEPQTQIAVEVIKQAVGSYQDQAER